MRSLFCGALAGFSLAFVNVAAFATERENILSITSNDLLLNAATLRIDGSRNGLAIVQEAPVGSSRANRMEVSITGDLNGGALRSALPAPLIGALPWGSLLQSGEGNAMTVSATGSGNLFAAAQRGNGNTLLASISGLANQAAVSQTGASNTAAFSQVGNGNMVSITQTSW